MALYRKRVCSRIPVDRPTLKVLDVHEAGTLKGRLRVCADSLDRVLRKLFDGQDHQS